MSILFRATVTIIVLQNLFYIVSCDTTKCVNSKTCGQCVGESSDCAWCAAADHIGPRCQVNSETNAWCHGDVQYPQSHRPVQYVRNEAIAGKTPVVQLTPQQVKLSVRPGQTVNFTLTFRPAEDYPLDIYYLMDSSYTMKSWLTVLKEQGKNIYDKLNGFTNNVVLGIGSFVEKKAMPFTGPAQYAYSFNHVLSLTKNKTLFKNSFRKVIQGTNLDDPEAGLDALMQAMVCKDEIGWRNSSRKIIVLCTDSTYHSAGDGKIAGAAKLNDMKCHLKNGAYSKELEHDYPSVNQIQKIAKQENIIIIFNVADRAKREYKSLSDRILSGAEYVQLEEKSDIVDIITNVYLKAAKNLNLDVKLPRNGDHELVQVKLTPDCTIRDNAKCEVEHHKDFVATVSVTADSCLGDNNILTIQPVGLEESLKIEVETLCKCECEKHGKPNAKQCSGSGSLRCGICECNANRFGDICDCIGSSLMNNSDKCKANGDDSVLCSGHGVCRCGKCAGNCHEDYSGDFCQYHDKACSRDQLGRLCADHGRCHEGRCKCFPGWMGEDCHCPDDDSKCRAPHSDGICSGNGKCVCGDCVCTKIDSKNKTYFGSFCDNCFECDEVRCKDLEKYVQCVYSDKKTKSKCDKEFHSKNTIVTMANKTEIEGPEYHLAKSCRIVLDDGKTIIFKHMYEDKILHIIIQKELEEPDRANMWIAIGTSIGVILLIGLLTVVLWKICVDRYDAREYQKFNKLLDESGNLENIDNVIYKAPTVTFSNPLFNRKSRMY